MKGKTTIGEFASLAGKNPIDVLSHLMLQEHLKIYCSYEEEWKQENIVLKTPKRLVIDIISLVIINDLGISDKIVSAFGKLAMAQTTFDLLSMALQENVMKNAPNYQANLRIEGNKFSLEKNPMQICRNIDFLTNLIDWVKNNCEIVPVRAALHFTRKKRAEISKKFEDSFIDTILIAMENGNILYSDDAILRKVAKLKFKVNGTWTQMLLLHGLAREIFSVKTYDEAVAELLIRNFSYIDIRPAKMLKNAKQSKWIYSFPNNSSLEILSKNTTEGTTLLIAAQFLLNLYFPAPLKSRKYLLECFLETIIHKEEFLNRLISLVKTLFYSYSLLKNEILSILYTYKSLSKFLDKK